jgi:hypothetical protein
MKLRRRRVLERGDGTGGRFTHGPDKDGFQMTTGSTIRPKSPRELPPARSLMETVFSIYQGLDGAKREHCRYGVPCLVMDG